nr:putative disease resistance protein rga4 [Quercus suber]
MEGSRGQSYFGSYKKKRARSNGPSQLKELRNLGGNLRIVNLGHGKDEVDANLKEKRHLQQLLLEWDASEWDGETDELLEGLQPHPNLKALELQYYMGLESDGIFNYFRPCNCVACPRIASGLSESAENNFFRTNLGKEQAWVQNSDPIQKLQLCNKLRTRCKFLRTLKRGLDQATNTAAISLLNRKN